jgi:hypothetical protein
MSARREPPGVLVVIRCAWPRCNYRLGSVYPIRQRIDGDPQAFVVTFAKKGRGHIESMIPADFSGTVPIALCTRHPHEIDMLAYPADGFRNVLARARMTGRTQELLIK